MTSTPEAIPPPKKEAKEPKYDPLESLFYYGYAESDVIEIYKDEESSLELKAKFRTLTPIEVRDITELIGLYNADAAQTITEKIETLARAILYINYMPLILSPDEQQKYYDRYGKNPSPLEMSKIILEEKIKSMFIIDALYTAYVEFANDVFEKLEEAKKKLGKKQPNSI
jgi:hypothetical protein